MPNPGRLKATIDEVLAAPQPAHVRDLAHISRARLRAAHDAGLLVSLRRGVVVPSDLWQQSGPTERHLLSLRAALLAYPGSWASHSSALLLKGVDVRHPNAVNDIPVVHISRTGTTLREPGLVVHGQSVPDEHVIETGGLPTSSVIRASIEVAAQRSLPYAVAVLDASMRATIMSGRDPIDGRHAVLRVDLREAATAAWDSAIAPYSRHRWVTTIREALRLADPAAESYLETRSRLAIADGGLPRPLCGIPMVGDNGILYWLDFWWEEYALIGEADGLGKYHSDGTLLSEKLRQEALFGPGRGMVRWGMAQVVPDPRPMLARIRAALESSPPRGMGWW